ncbi:MAG: hypothetical protein AABY07_07900 [Nanoarchaeota archaeon]
MVANRFTAYSGTTLENYMTCATLVGNEVEFDKSREPEHFYREIYYEDNLIIAINQSINLAKTLNHFPLVMEGKLEAFYKDRFHLEIGECFPVNKVYIPKSAVVSADLTVFEEGNGNLNVIFTELNPLCLLR